MLDRRYNSKIFSFTHVLLYELGAIPRSCDQYSDGEAPLSLQQPHLARRLSEFDSQVVL